jgi:hypothetical protein
LVAAVPGAGAQKHPPEQSGVPQVSDEIVRYQVPGVYPPAVVTVNATFIRAGPIYHIRAVISLCHCELLHREVLIELGAAPDHWRGVFQDIFLHRIGRFSTSR